jgi:hypothetical protein
MPNYRIDGETKSYERKIGIRQIAILRKGETKTLIGDGNIECSETLREMMQCLVFIARMVEYSFSLGLICPRPKESVSYLNGFLGPISFNPNARQNISRQGFLLASLNFLTRPAKF